MSRKDHTDELAKWIAAACLAYQMDLSFDTAMRDYVGPGRVGELWKTAARFILTGQTGRSPNFFPEEMDMIVHWSNRLN
jgi:hypothetical protein